MTKAAVKSQSQPAGVRRELRWGFDNVRPCVRQVGSLSSLRPRLICKQKRALIEGKGQHDVVSRVERGAKLRLGNEVLAELRMGTKIKVVTVKGEWVGGDIERDGERIRGWIHVKYVRSGENVPSVGRPAPDSSQEKMP